MSTQQPLVGILMGSDSDWPIMRKCAETLKSFGIAYEANVLSAHRTPDQALDYAATAQARGLKVLIGAAGAAAHLAGVLAAKTELPVLADPVRNLRRPRQSTRSSNPALKQIILDLVNFLDSFDF